MRLFFRTKAILAIFHKDKYLILGHKFDPPGLWLKFAKPGASHQADCECEEADVKLDGTAFSVLHISRSWSTARSCAVLQLAVPSSGRRFVAERLSGS